MFMCKNLLEETFSTKSSKAGESITKSKIYRNIFLIRYLQLQSPEEKKYLCYLLNTIRQRMNERTVAQ